MSTFATARGTWPEASRLNSCRSVSIASRASSGRCGRMPADATRTESPNLLRASHSATTLRHVFPVQTKSTEGLLFGLRTSLPTSAIRVLVTSNAPAKLRRANTDSKPPRTSRAPAASAGCYAALHPIHPSTVGMSFPNPQQLPPTITPTRVPGLDLPDKVEGTANERVIFMRNEHTSLACRRVESVLESGHVDPLVGLM